MHICYINYIIISLQAVLGCDTANPQGTLTNLGDHLVTKQASRTNLGGVALGSHCLGTNNGYTIFWLSDLHLGVA